MNEFAMKIWNILIIIFLFVLQFTSLKYITGYTLLDNGALNIESANVKDAGVYICIAQNNAGTAVTQVRLEVQGQEFVYSSTDMNKDLLS